MGEYVKRTLTLDLDRVADAILERAEVSDEEVERARRGRNLVRSILGMEGGKDLTAADVVELEDEDFTAAHQITEGGSASAALQAAAEQIDPDAFTSLRSRLMRLRPEPDPDVAREFI